MDGIYLKRTKTKGNIYYKIFRRVPGGHDEYIRMAGTPRAILEKLVLLDKLKGEDQQIKQIKDQLRLTETKPKKDQQTSINENPGFFRGREGGLK